MKNKPRYRWTPRNRSIAEKVADKFLWCVVTAPDADAAVVFSEARLWCLAALTGSGVL